MKLARSQCNLPLIVMMCSAVIIGCSNKITSAQVRIAIFSEKLERLYSDIGRYPSEDEGLSALIIPPIGTEESWGGPYLNNNTLPKDPWGNLYVYRNPQELHCYVIYSLGPNATDDAGSEDDIGTSNCGKDGTPIIRPQSIDKLSGIRITVTAY